MNRKLIYILFLFLGFVSCDDYLKDDSGDLLIPKKVSEFIPVLYAEGYPKSFNTQGGWIELMTDDVELSPLEQGTPFGDPGFDELNGGEGRQAYKWKADIEETLQDLFWSSMYEYILGCNIIIDALPDMEYSENETGQYHALASQAYALRAYYYFCLVNTYALPWSEANLDKLGVIIRTTPQIDVTPRERSSIREVYKLINEDLEKALEHGVVGDVSANKHILTPAAIQLLATRVALFQEDWDKVIELGVPFMQDNSSIFDLNSVSEDKMGTDDARDFTMFNMAVNNEIIFTFGTNSYKCSLLSYYPTPFDLGFRVSYKDEGSLIKSYEEDDLRLLAYFMQDYYDPGWPGLIDEEWKYKWNYPIKYKSGSTTTNYHENWRNVEVLLNLAEAYARKSNTVSEDAIGWLNKLRKNRIRKAVYEDLSVADFQNKEALVKFIWTERRRELCFEEHMRFWDLRRQGMPRLVHKLYLDQSVYETYVLEQGSPNYVLAVPRSEMDYNSVVSSNPRENIVAQ
mgnify:FL=1